MRRVSRGSMMPSSHSRAVANSAVDSASKAAAQAFAHGRQRGFVGRLAGAFEFGAADDLHHLGRLRRTHHGGARRGPGEDEARVEAAPAHAVVAGAEGAAEHHGELGHARIGHGLDHLGAVLDGAGALRRRADHVAGGVLQEDQRRAALVAELDELRGLGRAGGLDRAVVAEDADGVAVQAGMAADVSGE
jgi:hypothetical protein